MKLDTATASRMVGIALGHVAREYPHKLDHVLLGDEDALPPRVLHPIFFGSFDWHSCVHGWWTLADAAAAVSGYSGGRHDLGARETKASRQARSEGNWPISTGRSVVVSSDRMAGRGCCSLHLEAARHDASWACRAGTPRATRLPSGFAITCHAHLSDPRRHAFQHVIRADSRAGMGEELRRRVWLG